MFLLICFFVLWECVCFFFLVFFFVLSLFSCNQKSREVVEKKEKKVGEATARALYGQGIAGLFTIVMIVSMFGALNGNILVGPRVTYAMAKDNLFFPSAAKVHPKNHTPGNAIIIQGVWSGILALSGTFEELITLVVFVNFMMWIAAASTVFVLRKKQPDLDRPYKVWGYPYVPAFFIILSSAIMVNTFFESPTQSFIGIGLTLLGIPAYYYWKKISISKF